MSVSTVSTVLLLLCACAASLLRMYSLSELFKLMGWAYYYNESERVNSVNWAFSILIFGALFGIFFVVVPIPLVALISMALLIASWVVMLPADLVVQKRSKLRYVTVPAWYKKWKRRTQSLEWASFVLIVVSVTSTYLGW